MNLSNEQRQRETDRAFGIHESRMSDRARFGSPLSADLFGLGADALREQAKFAPPPISENDPVRLAAIADEVRSEGRAHVNTRAQRHE